ncbi:hypothetical protein [Comamonas sp. HJ-2]
MQDNSDLIIRDCCEAEVAEFGQPDTICITVDFLREIVQRHFPGTCLHQIQEPAAPVVLPEPAIAEVMKLVELHRQEIIKVMDDEGSLVGVQSAQDAIEAKLRALLATATGLPAQAATEDERAAWFALAMNAAAYIEDAVVCLRDGDAKRAATGAAKHVREKCNALWDSAPQAQADARDAEITWPKARDVGRIGDMSQVAHIRVGFDSDNDVFVSVWDENGGGSIEFCNPGGGGGGQSSRTRTALIALMVAMEADNAEKPSRDWWAQRAAIAAAKGE